MKFAETGSAIDFDPAPIGPHIARCIRIIDLGTILDPMYQKEKHQVFIMWEIPEEIHTYTVKDKVTGAEKEIAEPFTIGKFYNMSLSEGAHLRTDLESWRSRPFTPDELQGFEAKNILSKPCMINVVHKPKKAPKKGVNALIVSITPLVKGLECPPQVHPAVFFSLDEDEFDLQVFDGLSPGLKAKVMQSNEYRELVGAASGHQQHAMSEAEQASQDAMAAAGGQPMDDGFDDIPF